MLTASRRRMANAKTTKGITCPQRSSAVAGTINRGAPNPSCAFFAKPRHTSLAR
jgi:hypothetical protein